MEFVMTQPQGYPSLWKNKTGKYSGEIFKKLDKYLGQES